MKVETQVSKKGERWGTILPLYIKGKGLPHPPYYPPLPFDPKAL